MTDHYDAPDELWLDEKNRKYWLGGAVNKFPRYVRADLYQEQAVLANPLAAAVMREACRDVYCTGDWEWHSSADDAMGAIPLPDHAAQLAYALAMPDKYGRRNVAKMIGQIDALRHLIASEVTPAVQDAWDKVEEHIDYAYRLDNPEMLRLRAGNERLEAQLAAADGLVEAWADFDKPLLRFGSFNEMRRTARTAIATYRAAKGE